MCGIFCYIGKKDPIAVCIDGLKKLEYRGYDSAGLAGFEKGKIISCKEVGKVESLEKKAKLSEIKLDLGIAHTRWATHGEPTLINTHPLFDSEGFVAVVHNGIIENFEKIRKKLASHNIKFSTQTDTEVIAQLISYNYKGDMLEAIIASLKELKGSLAIAVIHKDYPDQIVAASRESPLAVGYTDDKNEILISSDPNAFLGRNLNVFYMKRDEIAVIKSRSVEVFDTDKKNISKETEKIEGENLVPNKEGYEHFMLKEIFEQPFTIQKTLMGHYSDEFGTAEFENLNFSSKELIATRHIIIIACGTSWHAGCVGASLLEELARIPTQAEIASEFRFKNPIISEDTLVIAISQSGETADTIAAMREAKAKGAKILSICNVQNSTIAREAHSSLFLKAGPEISVCSTKAFTSQITLLSLFALFMGRLRHINKEEGQAFLNELKKIPSGIRLILSQASELKKLAKKYCHYNNFFFLGRRHMFYTALEAALKLKEISYINATGYPAGELKHGPIALISKKTPVIAFMANSQTYEKMRSNLEEVKARGAVIFALAPEGYEELKDIADDIFWLPRTTDYFSVLTSSVAAQLFAYYVAETLGADIDHPKNLAKSVTVE